MINHKERCLETVYGPPYWGVSGHILSEIFVPVTKCLVMESLTHEKSHHEKSRYEKSVTKSLYPNIMVVRLEMASESTIFCKITTLSDPG